MGGGGGGGRGKERKMKKEKRTLLGFELATPWFKFLFFCLMPTVTGVTRWNSV